MNRRTYLKYNILIMLGGLGITSLSFFKWIGINTPVNIHELWARKDLIAELAEIIIPATDTPGAKDAFVQEYIINVIINCNSFRQQHIFFTGLNDLEKYTIEVYKKEFLKCTPAEKESVVAHVAKSSAYSFSILDKIHNKIWGETFYFKLYHLTVEGYCLSKTGATKGLAYDYIPVNYEACIPLKPNQKSWATK